MKFVKGFAKALHCGITHGLLVAGLLSLSGLAATAANPPVGAFQSVDHASRMNHDRIGYMPHGSGPRAAARHGGPVYTHRGPVYTHKGGYQVGMAPAYHRDKGHGLRHGGNYFGGRHSGGGYFGKPLRFAGGSTYPFSGGQGFAEPRIYLEPPLVQAPVHQPAQIYYAPAPAPVIQYAPTINEDDYVFIPRSNVYSVRTPDPRQVPSPYLYHVVQSDQRVLQRHKRHHVHRAGRHAHHRACK